MGNSTLPPVRNFSYDCSHKKAAVPRVTERPTMGLKSDKNFIVSNAIENILSTARKVEAPANYLEKKDYGRVPNYLNRIKDSIEHEYKMIQTLHEQHQENKYLFFKLGNSYQEKKLKKFVVA